MTNRICSIEGCGRDRFKRDLCSMHYDRVRLHGTPGPAGPLIASRTMSAADRLAHTGWDEVLRVPELGVCHEWRGARHPQGYGQVRVDGRVQPAHRVALEVANGRIPPGLFACHRCDNPPCVNAAHLYAGTPRQNTIDFYARSGIQRPRGNDHPMMKVTDVQVAEIRGRFAAGGILKRELAAEYGLHPYTVGRIINGHSRA